MRKTIPYLAMLVALMFSVDASAAVLVTTYDAFTPMVDALTRAALIFSDNSFTSTAYAFGYAGLVVGAVGVLTSLGQGRVINPVAFAIPFVLGAAMLTAIIGPKDDIYVFDKSTWEIGTVSSFPAPLAQVLSWVTRARDAIISQIDTAAPPGSPVIWDYSYNVGGMSFDILMRALSKAGELPDQYLNASVEKYIDDCLPVGMSVNNLDWNDLNSGNVEFRNLLAQAAHPSFPTGYFTATNKQGIYGTCADSWAYLGPKLDEVATQDMFKKSILAACEDHGIRTELRDSSASNSSNWLWTAPYGQNWRCEDAFSQSVLLAVGETGSPPWTPNVANAWRWMRQLYLGHKIHEWAASTGPNGLANYNQVIDRIGWAGQAAQWMPMLRASILAFAIALTPFSLLFLLTGAGSRALFFPLGMILYVVVWEVMDAFSHSFLMEEAFRVAADAMRHQIGLVGLAKLSPATVKMMTAFGTIRMMSAVLATSFMYVVFKFGGMAMANLASSFAASSQAAGSDAMRKTVDPVQHGQWLQALSQSDATQFAVHGTGGWSNYQAGQQYNASSAAQTATNTATALGGAGVGSNRTAAVNAGRNTGGITGAEDVAKATDMTPTQAAAMAAAGDQHRSMSHGIGTELAVDQATQAGGDPIADLVTGANFGTSQDIGGGAQLNGDTGGSPTAVSDIGRSVGGFRNLSQRAANDMARAAAQFAGLSLGDSLRGEAGNRQIAMGPQAMSNFLAANPELANNLSAEARDRLGTHGGTLSMAVSSSGDGKSLQVSSMSLRNSMNGQVDWSSTVDDSTKLSSGVQSTAGPTANNALAARHGQVEAMRNLRDELQSALESGDVGRVQAVALQVAEYTGTLLGVQSQASANEQGMDSKSLSAEGHLGGSKEIGGGKKKAGKGEAASEGRIAQAVRDLATGGFASAAADVFGLKGEIGGGVSVRGASEDRRSEQTNISGGGYYAAMSQWAAQAMDDYKAAMANPNANGTAVVNGEFRDMVDAAQGYWAPKVEQLMDTSKEQGEQLNSGSGVVDDMKQLVGDALKKYW